MGPKIDLHLEGTATDAVHLTRYSNAAVTNADKNVRDKLKSIDKVIEKDLPIDNHNGKR